MFRILDLEEYLYLIEYDQAKYSEYIVLDYVVEDKTGYARPRWSKRDAHGNIVRLFAPETEEFLFSLRAKLYGYTRDETEYRKLFAEGRYEDAYLSRVQSHLKDEDRVSSEEEVVVSPEFIRRGSVVNIAEKYEAKEAEVAALKEPKSEGPPAKPYKNFTRVKIDDPALYESSFPGFYYFDHPYYYDHPSRVQYHQERLTDEEILRSKVRELREQAMIDNITPDSDQNNDDVIADHKELRKRRGSVSHLASSFETAELANKLERQIDERPGSARGYTRDPIYRYNPRYRYYSEREWKHRVGIDREPRYHWEVHQLQEKPIENPEELNKRRGSVTKMANSFDSVAYRNEIERNMESDPRLRRDLVRYEVENGLYDYPLYSTRKNKVKDLSLLYQEDSEPEHKPKEIVRRRSSNDMRVRFECVEGRDSTGSEDDMELLRRQNSNLDEMKLRFRAEEKEEEEKVTPDSLDLEEAEEYEISHCHSTLSPVMMEKYRKKKQRSRVRSSPEPRKLARSKSIDQIAHVFEVQPEEQVEVDVPPRELIRISDEDSDDAVKRRSSISNIALQWEEGMETEPAPKDPTLVHLYTDSDEFTDSSEAGVERKMRVADRARYYVERRESEDQEMEEQRKWAPLPTTFPDPVPLYNSSEEEEYKQRMKSDPPTKPSRSGPSITWVEPGESGTSDSSSDLEEVRRRSVSDRALRYVQKREEEEAALEELERWEPLPDPLRQRTSLEEESWTRDTFTDTNLTTEDQGFGSISMERHSSRDQDEEDGRDETGTSQGQEGDESGIAHSSDSANFGDSRDSSSSNSIQYHET